MSEWKPIESAPKDGTRVLVASTGKATVAAWDSETYGPGASGSIQPPGWRACAMEEFVYDEGWDTGTGYKLDINPEPTHWMPLPEPPR